MAIVTVLILCLGIASAVQAMHDEHEKMNYAHAQHTGYSEGLAGRSEIPWYNRTVSMKTFLLGCGATFAITLASTLAPLRAQVSDLEGDKAYYSCCANMNYRAVSHLCPLNANDTGRVGGNCTPSPETRHIIWCDPDVPPVKPGTANTCSILKY